MSRIVSDPVVVCQNSVQVIFAGDFLNALNAWIRRECPEGFDDSLLNRLSERVELSLGKAQAII